MQSDGRRLRDRHGLIGQAVGYRNERLRRHPYELGQSAIDLESKCPILGTEVRSAPAAPFTATTPNPRTGDDPSSDRESRRSTSLVDHAAELVTERHWRSSQDRSVIPFGGIGPADGRQRHPEDDFIIVRFAGLWNVGDPHVSRPAVDCGPHPAVLIWTLMLVFVSLAAVKASVAWLSGSVAVTILDGSTAPLAMNLIVCGQTPIDPMRPRMRRAFDWINPSATGAVAPTLIPAKARRPE